MYSNQNWKVLEVAISIQWSTLKSAILGVRQRMIRASVLENFIAMPRLPTLAAGGLMRIDEADAVLAGHPEGIDNQTGLRCRTGVATLGGGTAVHVQHELHIFAACSD